MIRLDDRNLQEFTRQSSKGNQLKWEKEGMWCKADFNLDDARDLLLKDQYYSQDIHGRIETIAGAFS